ncbi:peptidoglycan-recognition protein LD isoform X2 [Drosophila innubila]|uniref:peptidoglycan-recognition protein LD isoform X2 n=1 Tax=Drosophila innubila TaxID=198719 RepID=UPI00148B6B06|nr:peptidoglycan-recognition protein LD isoform X2 [Drosophila innubila]
MEINRSVAHVTDGGDHDDSLTSSTVSFNSTEICIESNERTPLLSRSDSSQETPTSTAPCFYTKECLNWRTIGLLVMFTIGLAVATYLLWRENFGEIGYRLSLTQHDIWSAVQLEDQTLLEAGKVVNVYVTHTASEECTENCAQLLNILQSGHLGELPYNFLMAGDCEAYEARGWRYVSNYGRVPQKSSLVLAFVGDFSVRLPSDCQLETAEALLRESLRRKKLQPGYQLYALSNVSRGELDADALQHQLRQWPLYAGQQKVK